MELLTSKMKEKKDKIMWIWIKKNIKQVVLWSVIILIFIPLAVYCLSEISFLPVTGGNDWAGFWGGYFGAIIGGICTVVGVFLSIRYEKEKSLENDERAVLPYIALTTLEKEVHIDFFHLKNIDDIEESDHTQEYREFMLDRIYFVIRGDDITPKHKLSREEKVLLENNGNYMDEVATGCYSLAHKKMISIPIILENVGNGAAVDFRVGVHSGDTKYNDEGIKYTVPKHLIIGKTFYLNLYFEDVGEYAEKKQFVLRICYENIYTQTYIQEYTINIENGVLQLDLGQRQKKV